VYRTSVVEGAAGSLAAVAEGAAAAAGSGAPAELVASAVGVGSAALASLPRSGADDEDDAPSGSEPPASEDALDAETSAAADAPGGGTVRSLKQ
jgi:hypothetical protein